MFIILLLFNYRWFLYSTILIFFLKVTFYTVHLALFSRGATLAVVRVLTFLLAECNMLFIGELVGVGQE